MLCVYYHRYVNIVYCGINTNQCEFNNTVLAVRDSRISYTKSARVGPLGSDHVTDSGLGFDDMSKSIKLSEFTEVS